jgi:hypothetical protein
MSALGQKQTCAPQKAMSALPPKATTSGPPLQIIRWNGAFRATRFPARGLGKQQGSDRKQDPKPATDAATIIACASCTSHGTDHRVGNAERDVVDCLFAGHAQSKSSWRQMPMYLPTM